MACTHYLTPLHVLLGPVLWRLRHHGLRLLPVLEQALLNDLIRGGHHLLRVLLARRVWVAPVFRVHFEISLLLNLLARARLSRSRCIAVEVIDKVLRVDCLGCVGGAP